MSLPEILTECARLANGAGAGALASVAKRRGSLPMSGTAKMLVSASGARHGTVGGGCLEAEIIERAMSVLERRVPAASSHSLNAELAGDYGLTCGGTAEMVIEPVFPDPVLAAVYAEAAAVVARGERAVMGTALDWSDGPRKALWITANGAAHVEGSPARHALLGSPTRRSRARSPRSTRAPRHPRSTMSCSWNRSAANLGSWCSVRGMWVRGWRRPQHLPDGA